VEEGWRAFVAAGTFCIVGFLIAQSSSAQWGVLFGVFGFVCYFVGYFVGQVFGRERR
jgi:hypothetical protein